MTERSPLMGVALLVAPTVGVIAIRMGIPALEDVIKKDLIVLASIHLVALILGFIMFRRYRVVEDHEFHRSSAIKAQRKMYQMEDKGLWDKGRESIERLESESRIQPKGRAALKKKILLSGKISELNTEQEELELQEDDEKMSIDVKVEGMATIADSELIDNLKSTETAGFIGSRAEVSAQKRLQKQLAKQKKNAAKQAKRDEKAARKAEKIAAKKNKNFSSSKQFDWDSKADDVWDAPSSTSQTKSVASCGDCGALNNAEIAYCTSCGSFL
ncbi:MAG TPA: hypothetical protein QF508_05235 [Candidatus Thalassarchaeaceae archaeon]|nr:hypothetical protein [Candidatus Thalassarchaeaceae archaeon]